MFPSNSSHSTMERTTQTEPPRAKKWKQIWLCFLGDDKFRRQRQREATEKSKSIDSSYLKFEVIKNLHFQVELKSAT